MLQILFTQTKRGVQCVWLNTPVSRPDSGEPRSSQVTCICQVHELCHFAIDPHRPGGRSLPNVFLPFFGKGAPRSCVFMGPLTAISATFREAKTQSCDICMKHTAYLDLLLTYLKFETVNSHKQKGFRYL